MRLVSVACLIGLSELGEECKRDFLQYNMASNYYCFILCYEKEQLYARIICSNVLNLVLFLAVISEAFLRFGKGFFCVLLA